MGAMVDLKTGKITECKKDSFSWNHECGHLIFQDKFANWILIQQYAEEIMIGCLVIGFVLLFIYPLISYILSIVSVGAWGFARAIDWGEEKWCNSYAKFKTRDI
jgi:hypothetical protein